MGFLVGMGRNDPLRYRLLPVDEFCNIGAISRPNAGTVAFTIRLLTSYVQGTVIS